MKPHPPPAVCTQSLLCCCFTPSATAVDHAEVSQRENPQALKANLSRIGLMIGIICSYCKIIKPADCSGVHHMDPSDFLCSTVHCHRCTASSLITHPRFTPCCSIIKLSNTFPGIACNKKKKRRSWLLKMKPSAQASDVLCSTAAAADDHFRYILF